MSEFELRSARTSNIPDIVDIWARSFGDDPAFVSALLRDAQLLPTALCAAQGDRVCSVMFAFEGLTLAGKPAAYLYALCTHPEARGRGMGAAVVRALAQRCIAHGAETVFLSPADAQLDAWYARILDTDARSFFCDAPMETRPSKALCTQLDAAAYFAARRSEIGVTQQLLDAQQTLHRFFGGGFFRIKLEGTQALACAVPTDDALLIRELLCPEHLRAAVCGALANHFGCPRVLLRTVSGSGRSLVYITKYEAAKKALPPLTFPYLLE